MSQYHFIAGLPRSGSTLLSAILRQNPDISAGITSPAGTIFAAVQKSISGANEAAIFLSDAQREAFLRGAITGCHPETKIVIETNRAWPAKLPVLAKLFPDFRMVCCVRDPTWIVDSFERLAQRHPTRLSQIFAFEAGGTVYNRVPRLIHGDGLVGSAVNALKEGMASNFADRILLIEYDLLVHRPKYVIDAVYRWLNITSFAHDYSNVEQIPGVKEFDERGHTPGLHDVGKIVKPLEKSMILPSDIPSVLPAPFWRTTQSKATLLK